MLDANWEEFQLGFVVGNSQSTRNGPAKKLNLSILFYYSSFLFRRRGGWLMRLTPNLLC